MMNRLHFGDRGDGAFKVLKPDPPLGGQLDAQKHRDAKAERVKVQIQPPPGDHAGLLQTLDPPPGRRLAEAKPPTDLAGTPRGVGGQKPQNAPVGLIKHHIGSLASILISATCISASISAIWGSVRTASR